ncbi:MAG: AarF/ABC1/UbiB kinase family protein [Bdellovibrionales bacterium]|nr:AarF/ABC1/UbiB kinase family protein [Bdellovibrionales bacterium]
MQWVRTGMQLGQVVKNAQRLRQILAVLARHGFSDLVVRMNLGKFLPRSYSAFLKSAAEKNTPVRLREAFEELGPSFVKLGQLLSSRPDIIPESALTELSKLQDNVSPLSVDVVRGVVERELGKPIDQIFSFFDPSPLGAASIGQVHAAKLLSGEEVVVKVQRPEIRSIIETDIALLDFLAGLLEKYIPESRAFRPRIIVDEFFKTLVYELDYVVECNNMNRIAQNLSSIPEVAIPKVYKGFSTTRVLTLERLNGVRVNDLKALEAAGIDRKKLVSVGARAFFKMILVDGIFHGDLHAGNLFALPGNRLGVVDFGIVGRLSDKSREQLAGMMVSLITEDYEQLCYIYSEVSVSGQFVDQESFTREVRNMISPYIGLSLKEVNSGRLLIEATKIGAKYNIQVPGDWMLVFKALITIEGMGRTLDPDFDMLATGQLLVQDLLKDQLSPQKIARELVWSGKDVVALLQTLPRQLRWMMKKFASNEYALDVHVPEVLELRAQLDSNSRRQSLSILIVGLVIASMSSIHFQEGPRLGPYPLHSIVLLLIAGGLFLKLSFMRGRR